MYSIFGSVNKLSLLRNLFLVFVLFCKTPAVHFTSFLKMLCPSRTETLDLEGNCPSSGKLHLHSFFVWCTTYVTSSSSNSVQGNSGDTFNYPFWTGGNYRRAYSFKVDGLPAGLSYNGNANAPSINGSLPAPGNYNIAITGYRYPGLSGNRTPTYNLSLTVSGVQNHNLSVSAGSGGSVNGGGSYQQGTFPDPSHSEFGLLVCFLVGRRCHQPAFRLHYSQHVSSEDRELLLPFLSSDGHLRSRRKRFRQWNLQLWKHSSITASPSKGHAFLSWSGSGVTNPSTLRRPSA